MTAPRDRPPLQGFAQRRSIDQLGPRRIDEDGIAVAGALTRRARSCRASRQSAVPPARRCRSGATRHPARQALPQSPASPSHRRRGRGRGDVARNPRAIGREGSANTPEPDNATGAAVEFRSGKRVTVKVEPPPSSRDRRHFRRRCRGSSASTAPMTYSATAWALRPGQKKTGMPRLLRLSRFRLTAPPRAQPIARSAVGGIDRGA